jgi:hypothetical protein
MPRVGSLIDALVYHGIEIGTKLTSVDAWSPSACIGNPRPRHEPTRLDRP